MEITLYKEDGYSLWMLVERFPELLKLLNDETDPTDSGIVVFYRPSFGRAGRKDKVRQQFGEFDILIGTQQAVYAIESKCEDSGEYDREQGKVILDRDKIKKGEPESEWVQVRRHRIFGTYRKLWQEHKPDNWKAFYKAANNQFQQEREGWTMPKPGTLLSKSLEYVLLRLEGCGGEVKDVIVFFHNPKKTAAPSSYHSEFDCIPMPLLGFIGSRFLSIRGSSLRVGPAEVPDETES